MDEDGRLSALAKYPRRRGERHQYAVLDDDKVRLIRSLRAQGKTLKYIADRVGTVQSNVVHVLKGRSWSHVK
jgi:transcriptional regulator